MFLIAHTILWSLKSGGRAAFSVRNIVKGTGVMLALAFAAGACARGRIAI